MRAARWTFWRGGLALGGGHAAGAVLTLGRNLLLAWLLPVADFGLASTFALAAALVESATFLALDRLAVQARDGGRARVQATLHTAQLLRGVLGALLVAVLAGPWAQMLGVPELAWAYSALAAVPLLRGLSHLDLHRAERHMRFGPVIRVTLAGQFVAVAVAVPLALWLGDWRAMLGAVLAQQAAVAAGSHLAARRPWRLAADRAVLARAVRFGLPALGNALLLFAIFQGDRLLVGAAFGMQVLGAMALAAVLTLGPGQLLTKTLQTLLLPRLSALRTDRAAFARLARLGIEAGALAGAVLALAGALMGPPLLLALYGPDYALAAQLLPWLAAAQALRVAKSGLSLVAVAEARTSLPMLANLPRAAMLAAAVGAVAAGQGLQAVLLLGLVGEGISLALSAWLVGRSARLGGIARSLWPAAPAVAAALMAPLWPEQALAAAAAAMLAPLAMPGVRSRWARGRSGVRAAAAT